jgi:hypothetical protein
MKIWQIAVVSTTLGFTLPAVAQMAAKAELRSDVEARVKERLMKYDANSDGVITRDEMTAFTDARMTARSDGEFAAMDTDRNGSISRAEFDAFHASRDHDRMEMSRRREWAEGGMPPPPPPTPPVPPRPGDAAPPPPAPPAPPAVSSRMHIMAGGGDRIVIADAVKKALARFDASDANKDGMLSADERKAARDAWRRDRVPDVAG